MKQSTLYGCLHDWLKAPNSLQVWLNCLDVSAKDFR